MKCFLDSKKCFFDSMKLFSQCMSYKITTESFHSPGNFELYLNTPDPK